MSTLQRTAACRPRALIIALLLCALGVLAPASASASTAVIGNGTLSYFAASGEANVLTVQLSGGDYVLSDSGASITASSGCRTLTVHQVVCGAAPVQSIYVDAGDGNDAVAIDAPTPARVAGGPGDDRLYGGSSNDVLYGGSGNDVLDGRGGHDFLYGDAGDDRLYAGYGAAGQLSCGDGADAVRSDATDTVTSTARAARRLRPRPLPSRRRARLPSSPRSCCPPPRGPWSRVRRAWWRSPSPAPRPPSTDAGESCGSASRAAHRSERACRSRARGAVTAAGCPGSSPPRPRRESPPRAVAAAAAAFRCRVATGGSSAFTSAASRAGSSRAAARCG